MPRVYVFTVILSFIAGLIASVLMMSKHYSLLLILLPLLFIFILLNEKTAFLENRLSRRMREFIGLYLVVLLLLFVIILVFVSVVSR